jgi:hypothetical protein
MSWLRGWTKPVYRRRRGGLTGWLSPFTKTKAGGSAQVGPLTITATGRVYIFGARVR